MLPADYWFISVPEEVRKEAEERLRHLDQPRAGSVWTPEFEDGMRFVLCQLVDDRKRVKAIIEAYTEFRNMVFKTIHIREALRKQLE